MLDRRTFAKLRGRDRAERPRRAGADRTLVRAGRGAAAARGNYLIKNGAVITVDPALGVLPRADVHVRDGRIEAVGPDLDGRRRRDRSTPPT